MRQPGLLFPPLPSFPLELTQPHGSGTYGTNIELSAFVARYRRPVKVYQPNLVYVLPVEDQSPSAPSGSASTSTSPPPPPAPPPGAEDTTRLTPRERRARAREEKARKKEEKHRERVAASRGAQGMKGKGREEEADETQVAEEDEQEEEEVEQRDGGREAARADEAPLCIVCVPVVCPYNPSPQLTLS